MKPTQLALLIGSLVLTGLLGYHRIYLPKNQEVASIHQQIAQEKTTQATREEVVALLAQVERYRQRLPDEADPSWVAREVVTLGKQAKIQLANIAQESPQPIQSSTSAKSPFTRLAVAFEFRTTYHQLGAFLDAIEGSDRYLRIDRLDVTADTDGSGQATVRLVVSTCHVPAAL